LACKEGVQNARWRSNQIVDFDRLVEGLERQVMKQARAVYSDKVIQEFRNLKNVGRMPAPDACGIVHGWCGDTMEICPRLDGERIEQATFMTDGCWPTVACGSVLTQMVTGISLAETVKIEPEDLIAILDGLPEENAHCAELAVNTLREAIANRIGPQVEG
jgi:nitrogen fixation NifU-like protein